MQDVSRRNFVYALGTAAALSMSRKSRAAAFACPFRVSVINDEISQDFDHVCFVVAREFGLQWIELRGMWDKNISELSEAQVTEARSILKKYGLRVTDIASPLFKTDFPGAPQSKESPRRDQFHATADPNQQDALLDHCIGLVRKFDSDRLRCFDYWRLDDPKPYRAAINAKLSSAATKCATQNVVLLLENEMACNTGTGEEAVETLAAVPATNFMLNWDPGNAGTFEGNVPYPDAYSKLPKRRIGHVHVKNVQRTAGEHKYEWEPVDIGLIDWAAQFAALSRDGYRYAVSLETHWRGAGTPEASTRQSWAGMQKAFDKAGLPCAGVRNRSAARLKL